MLYVFQNKNRLSLGAIVLSAVASTVASRAEANIIYDTFAPGNGFDGSNAIYVSPGTEAFGGIVYYANQSVAVPFAPPYASTFDAVTIASYYYTGTNIAKVSLMTSSNNFSPDIYLETITGDWGTPGSPPTFTSTVHTPLTAGQNYWIAVEPGGSDTVGLWFKNSPGYTGVFQLNPNNTGYIPLTSSILPAMRVEVSIPEPASISMLGLAGMMVLRRKRK